MTVHVTLAHFLVLSSILFVLGIFAMLTRKNAIAVLMGLELMLNAANINFVAFSRFGGVNLGGQMASLFVIAIAVCEAAVALAIVLNIYKRFQTIDVKQVHELKD